MKLIGERPFLVEKNEEEIEKSEESSSEEASEGNQELDDKETLEA